MERESVTVTVQKWTKSTKTLIGLLHFLAGGVVQVNYCYLLWQNKKYSRSTVLLTQHYNMRMTPTAQHQNHNTELKHLYHQHKFCLCLSLCVFSIYSYTTSAAAVQAELCNLGTLMLIKEVRSEKPLRQFSRASNQSKPQPLKTGTGWPVTVSLPLCVGR